MEENKNLEPIMAEVVTSESAQIIRELISNGAKRYNSLTIRSIEPTEKDKYVRMDISLDRELPAILPDADGVYSDTTSANMYSSNYAISGLAKTIDDVAMFANDIANPEKVKGLKILLNRAVIDVVQVRYPGNIEFVNPFSTKKTPQLYDHDVIVNYIVNLKLGEPGKKILDIMYANAAAIFG